MYRNDLEEYSNRVYSKTINSTSQLHHKCRQCLQRHYSQNGKESPVENVGCNGKFTSTEHCNNSDNDEIQHRINTTTEQSYATIHRKTYLGNVNSSSSKGNVYLPANFYQVICLVTLGVLCYYNSTQCGLVFDDISAIRDNKDLRPFTPFKQIFLNDFWGTPMRKEQSHKSYRPLTVLTFRLNYWLHELQPYGYHIINIILHIAVCILWRHVSRLLMLQCTLSEQFADECSFVSALLFIVHPIHTEAVTGVVGRAELLSSLFYLAAFLCYVNAVHIPFSSIRQKKTFLTTTTVFRTRWINLVIGFTSCLLASMLCKEQGITVAGVCVAYEVFVVHNIYPIQLWYSIVNVFESNSYSSTSNQLSPIKYSSQRLSWRSTTANIWSPTLLKRLCFLCGVVLLLLVGRVYVMGLQLPIFTRFDNPASVAPAPQKQLTYGYLIYLNTWLLLFPCDLCCDWTMGKFNKVFF